MNTDLVLTPPEPKAITPQEMIQTAFQKAIEQGAAMDVVQAIIAQQRWMIEHNEEEAFNQALKRIQRQLKAIPKKGFNNQTNSWYATAQSVDDAIQHLLDQEGMTLSFVPQPSEKPEMVLIVGVLALGAYSKSYPLEMPADGKGAKGGGVMTRTHATGSAITYGKRYLKNMIFDLRFKEHDDDGNGASGDGSEGLPDYAEMALITNIENAASKKELFRIQMASIAECTKAGDMGAQKRIMAACDKRMEELNADQV